MKKGWKIALISVGSLLGLVVATVAVALWLVFTPSQLTKIVNRLATNYVTCETHFGRVNLTLFKTFPDAGLTIDDVYVVNPMDGVISDTMAHIGSLTVGVDVKKYLKEKEVVVHQLLLHDAQASLYIDSSGNSNFDIFKHSDDKDDTTKSTFSLDSLPNIDLRHVNISNLDAQLLNEKGKMYAEVTDLDVNIVGVLTEGVVDADLDLDADKMMLTTTDSIGETKIYAVLDETSLALKANGNLDKVTGKLKMELKKGRFNDMVNATLQTSKHDLLKLEVPFNADLLNKQFLLDDSRLQVDDYALGLKADVRLDPMTIDAVVNTDGTWQVAPLLELLPMQVLPKGMDVDGKVKLQAYAYGEPSSLKVDATVGLADGRFLYPEALPYKVNRISGDFDASLDLSKKTPSNVKIKSLKAHTRNTDVSVKGRVDDLLGDMHVDANIKGSLPLEDAMPMVPDSLKLTMSGDADVDMHARFKMSQLKAQDYEHMAATGSLNFHGLDANFDSIHATADVLALNLQLPAKVHAGKLADTRLTAGVLKLAMPGIEGTLDNPDIHLGVNNPMKEQLAAAVELTLGKSHLNLDSSRVDLVALSLNGSVRLDSNGTTVFNKYNPRLNVAIKDGMVASPTLTETAYLNKFDFRYSPERCEVVDADIMFANSDFQLYGSLENLEPWLEHKAMLVGDLNLTSHYTDVDQILALVSGMGSDADTLEQMRREDNVPQEANPFIVPKDVDVTLHTHIKRSLAFGNDLGDLAGAITVKDGIAVLDQIGFVCKAATMQLTAIYKSPRPSHLFTAIDFHLLDIQIDELLNMIPVVDTLVPMLAAFEGNANFHLAAESYLNASYQPLMSSLKGAAAISGTDLTVMDNNSIAQIAKLMQFKSWKDKDNKIKIDSLDVELTCLNKVIEVYPFLLTLGKYQICASGMHSLDNQCGYHLELLKNPLLARVGVDVKGSLSNPKISLGEVRYADFFRPDKQGVVEKQTLELKRQVKQALEAKVR